MKIKTLLIFILTALLIAALVGCTQPTDDVSGTMGEATGVTTAEESTTRVPETTTMPTVTTTAPIETTTAPEFEMPSNNLWHDLGFCVVHAAESNMINETYYGQFSGWHIVFFVADFDKPTSFTVADYEFSYDTSFLIYAYKDSVAMSLAEAYDKGHITDEDLAVIVQRYEKYTPEFSFESAYGSFVQPTVEQMEEIKKLGKGINIANYYGIHKGYIVFSTDGIIDDSKTIFIGDYTFAGSSAFAMNAYKDGVIYDLVDLYEEGVMTDADIEAIYYFQFELWEFYHNN